MKTQFLAAFVSILALATPAAQAGPVFTGETYMVPGPGGAGPNIFYSGLNDYYGMIPCYGVYGVGTPLNSGSFYSFSGDYVSFSYDNSYGGSFDFGNNDITGTIVTSAVSSTGGSFTFDGTTSAAFDAYYGLAANTTVVGTATIEMGPVYNYPIEDEIGSMQFTFTPGPAAVPEPSSVVLLGTGVLGVVGVLLRQRRRA